MIRGSRSGVEDLWTKSVRNDDGTTSKVPSKLHGKGSRWRARYVDAQGREHSKAFGRKSDAQAWIENETAGHVTGTWTDPKLSGVTFGVIAERWFATKATRAPKTVAGYRSLLDTLVLPRWENVALREVSFEDLQQWVTGLSVDGSFKVEGKGLSPSRVIQAHQVVSQVLKYAVRAKHLPTSPAEGIELPRKPEIEKRYLTHEQLHRLAVAAGRFRTFVLVLGYCGLRFGEAAALRVSDVDLKARRIRVKRSVTYVTGQGLVEGPTKNHSARTVPVPKFLAPLLKTEIGDRAATDLLFPSRRDGWLTEGEVRWVFDPAAIAVGVDGLTPHELRHTCASLAITAGANVKVLQTLLGHKTATLTLDRYGHLFPDDLDRIADAFDGATQTAAYDLRTIPAVGPVRPI
jgi:integrase